jgi:hypothetical protein
MNLDDFAVPWEDEIRGPWEILPVESVPETQSVGNSADDQFRFGISLADATHMCTALGRSE